MTPFPWSLFSKKMEEKIMHLRGAGRFTPEDAAMRHMELVEVSAGEEGNQILFSMLMDREDGELVDVRFLLFGDSILLAMGEIFSTFFVRKHPDELKKCSIERLMRELESDEECFIGHLEIIMEAIQKIPSHFRKTPLPDTPSSQESYPGWEGLSKERKLSLIEELFAQEIRPYVEMDEGGVKVLDLQNDREVVISYEGNCTSCYSAIGSTLSAIQSILQEKLDQNLVVIPNLDNFASSEIKSKSASIE